MTDVADLEEIADRLRDVEPAADLSLLFVETDDAYLAILRLDGGEDLRVFASDAAFADDSRLGALLLGDLAETVVDLDSVASDSSDDDDSPAPSVLGEPDPIGDVELLADLGLPSDKLLALCAQEGMLPSDITAEICQAIGCGDEVEELREA